MQKDKQLLDRLLKLKFYSLPKDFAEKWIEALRSNDYIQGEGSLCDGDRYCCLGVACIVAEVHTSTIIGLNYIDPDLFIGINNDVDIPENIQGEENTLPLFLSELNDGVYTNLAIERVLSSEIHNVVFPYPPSNKEEYYKLTFSQIADFIEKNIKLI